MFFTDLIWKLEMADISVTWGGNLTWWLYNMSHNLIVSAVEPHKASMNCVCKVRTAVVPFFTSSGVLTEVNASLHCTSQNYGYFGFYHWLKIQCVPWYFRSQSIASIRGAWIIDSARPLQHVLLSSNGSKTIWKMSTTELGEKAQSFRADEAKGQFLPTPASNKVTLESSGWFRNLQLQYTEHSEMPVQLVPWNIWKVNKGKLQYHVQLVQFSKLCMESM